MSSNQDDWDDYYGDLEELLEERMEEYLERLEADSYSNYYSSYNNKKKKSNEAYEALMRTYVQDLSRITEKLKPTSYTVISGSGPAWFYEPSTRKFIKTERGSEVVVIPGEVDENGNVLVRTLSTFLLVPKSEVMDIGYN
jgi:hypothetical protein|tara:strand:+ start:207 stop:626 length:420 start_codon:yes stop_codon:yes gene_type:complete